MGLWIESILINFLTFELKKRFQWKGEKYAVLNSSWR